MDSKRDKYQQPHTSSTATNGDVQESETGGNDDDVSQTTDISINVWDADETIEPEQIENICLVDPSKPVKKSKEPKAAILVGVNNDDETAFPSLVKVQAEEGKEEDFGDLEIGLMTAPLSSISTKEEEEQRFHETCEFVISFGLAAYKYGAVSYHVEEFMKALMRTYGYKGHFGIWNTELVCAMHPSSATTTSSTRQYNRQVMRMEALEGRRGFNLHKLSLLNDVAKNVIEGTTTPNEAIQAWDEIASEPDPWGYWTTMICWILGSVCVPVILRGGWWDCVGGGVCSIPIFILTVKLPKQYQDGLPFISSFLSAIIASVGKVYVLPDLNVAMVVVSATIVLIPGYDVSLACSELLSSHIIAGLDRLIHAFVVMIMLVGGGWLGSRWWDETGGLGSFPDPNSPYIIPLAWQGLFAPILMISLCILFQVSRRDIIWPFLSLVIAYMSFLVGSMVLGDENIGVLLGSTSATVYSQIWAKWFNRPRTLVILPTLVLLVSGSIGFRGLMQWSEGEKDDGLAQVTQMFVVAFLIITGLIVGSALVKAKTTL